MGMFSLILLLIKLTENWYFLEGERLQYSKLKNRWNNDFNELCLIQFVLCDVNLNDFLL